MKRLLLAMAATVLLMAACDNPNRPPAIASVRVAPDERILGVGETLALQATVHDVQGGMPTSPKVEWSSSNPAVATVDATGVVLGVAPGTATITATAGDESGSVQVTVAAAPAACTTPGAVRSLAVGEAVTLGGVQASQLCLDGGAAGKEYLAVPFNASGAQGGVLVLDLQAQGVVPVAPTSPSRTPGVAGVRPDGLVRDESFELELRRRERELGPLVDDARRAHRARRLREPGAPRFQTAAPAVGDRLRLNVRTSSNCENADLRTGRVVAVSQRAVVVADSANPAGGLTPAEYQAFGAAFDTLVYPVNVENFGEPEDIDENGRVIIFYTRAVNELTPPGSGAYIAGFFFSRDLFPKRDRDNLKACAGSNVAEMFYMLVPDPSGTVNSNPRSKDLILRTSVSTIAHEFQHLINASRRLYVLETGQWDEEVWLNEGLSHIAEELAFYRSAGLAPGQNVGAAARQASPRVDSAFISFQAQNLGRFDNYLSNPEGQSPYDVDEDLATRGAAWAFLRYAADRRGGSQAAFWRSLVDAPALGLDNLHQALGMDPRPWVRDWTVSVFTDDVVPGVAPRYQQPSWNFRSLFGGAFPLFTRRLAGNAALTLRLNAGSGSFVRFGVAPAGTGSVRLLSGGAPPPSAAMLTVVRTK